MTEHCPAAQMRARIAGLEKASCRTCAVFYAGNWQKEYSSWNKLSLDHWCHKQKIDPMPTSTTYDTVCDKYEPATLAAAKEMV